MTKRPAFLALLAMAAATGAIGAAGPSLAAVAVTVRAPGQAAAPAPGTLYNLHPGTRFGVRVENGSRLLVNYDGCWQNAVLVRNTNPNVHAVGIAYVWRDARGRRIVSLQPTAFTSAPAGQQVTLADGGCSPVIATRYPLISSTDVVPVVVVR